MPDQAATRAPGALSRRTSSPSSEDQRQAAEELARALATHERAVVACDPTLEGVLAAVGLTYFAHARPPHVRLFPRELCQPAFGEALIEAPSAADPSAVELAKRVYDGFERTISAGCPRLRGRRCSAACPGSCMRHLVYACAADDPEMPETIHRYLRLGFEEGPAVRDLLARPTVAAADALARFVANECEHTRQFVRFSHMADGSFFAVFRPRANTVPLTSGYFAARLGQERFCIADPVHGVAAFHEKGTRPQHMMLDRALMDELVSRRDIAADEERVRALWQTFYKSVSLPGRGAQERGYDLRASWMPKRFWAGLTELSA